MTYFGQSPSDGDRPASGAPGPLPVVPWGHAGPAASAPATAATAPTPGIPTFASAAEAAPAFTVVHPPLQWSALALGAGLLGLAVAIVWGGVGLIAVIAWVVGGPVCFALAALYVSVDTSRRTTLGYSRGTGATPTVLYVAALTAGLLAVCVAAVQLALWAGRGF